MHRVELIEEVRELVAVAYVEFVLGVDNLPLLLEQLR